MLPAPRAKQTRDPAIDTHANGTTVTMTRRGHKQGDYRPARMFSALDWCVAFTKNGQISAAGSVTVSSASMTPSPPDMSRSEATVINAALNQLEERMTLMAGGGRGKAAVLSATVAEIKEQTKLVPGVDCNEATVFNATANEIKEQTRIMAGVGCSEAAFLSASVAEIKEQTKLVIHMGCREVDVLSATVAGIKEQTNLVGSLQEELTREVQKVTVAGFKKKHRQSMLARARANMDDMKVSGDKAIRQGNVVWIVQRSCG